MSETTMRLKTTGMHCGSCAMNVDLTLDDLPGVSASKTDLAESSTTVTFDPEVVSVEQIIAAIKEAGYDASVDA